jgi:hypothetical protein
MTNKFAAFTNKFDEIRQKLQQQKQEQESGKKGTFDNSWKFKPDLPKDKSKIAFKIRILPNVHNPEAAYPWISAPFHMYRKPDGKFIYALCPSLNDNKEKGVKTPCPFCEKASALFKTQDKMDEDLAHKMYKKQRFFLNVLVIEDPRVGEENQKGKVLVYEYGKKVQEKLEDAMMEQKIDIINPLAGHDFTLVIKRQGEFTNYDSSSFSIEKTPVCKDEAEMNKIFDSIHNLNDKVLGRGAQTYDVLALKMNSIAPVKDETTVDPTESVDVEAQPAPKPAAKVASAPKVEKVAEKVKASADDEFDFNFEDDK